MTNQIFVFNTEYEVLCKIVFEFLDEWKDSKDCQIEYNNKDSLLFSFNYSSKKSYNLAVIPSGANCFTIIDSSNSTLQPDLAQYISSILNIETYWISVVGNSLLGQLLIFKNGELSKQKNFPEELIENNMPTYIDVEQNIYELLGNLGVKNELRFLYFSSLNNLAPVENLATSNGFIFSIFQEKKLFKAKMALNNFPVSFRVQSDNYSELAPAFPSFVLDGHNDTAFEMLLVSGQPSDESIKNLVTVLNSCADRLKKRGYHFLTYKLIESEPDDKSIYKAILNSDIKLNFNLQSN